MDCRASESMLVRFGHSCLSLSDADSESRNQSVVSQHILRVEPWLRRDYYCAGMVIADEIGDVARFPSAKNPVSWAGLATSIQQSGSRIKCGSIAKWCSRTLRWILIQTIHSACRNDERHRSLFERVVRRRGENTAEVAIARKMFVTIYQIPIHVQTGSDHCTEVGDVDLRFNGPSCGRGSLRKLGGSRNPGKPSENLQGAFRCLTFILTRTRFVQSFGGFRATCDRDKIYLRPVWGCVFSSVHPATREVRRTSSLGQTCLRI